MWAVGWMDLFSIYDGLRPLGIAEHMAAANRFGEGAWWEWPAAYPGDPIKSVIVGFAGGGRGGAVGVALSVSAAVRDRTGGVGVLTSAPYDADEFFWGHVAITVIAGAALTTGAAMSCFVRCRRS